MGRIQAEQPNTRSVTSRKKSPYGIRMCVSNVGSVRWSAHTQSFASKPMDEPAELENAPETFKSTDALVTAIGQI